MQSLSWKFLGTFSLPRFFFQSSDAALTLCIVLHTDYIIDWHFKKIVLSGGWQHESYTALKISTETLNWHCLEAKGGAITWGYHSCCYLSYEKHCINFSIAFNYKLNFKQLPVSKFSSEHQQCWNLGHFRLKIRVSRIVMTKGSLWDCWGKKDTVSWQMLTSKLFCHIGNYVSILNCTNYLQRWTR